MEEEMTPNPAYFAVITSDVLYNENLSALAKLLFAEISGLCHKEGFCWATNRYFAEVNHVSASTISRQVAALRDNGFINVEMECKNPNSKEVMRKIWIKADPYANMPSPLRKNADTPTQKCVAPLCKNAQVNNKANTKTNSISNKYIYPAELIAEYTDNKELADALNELMEVRNARKKKANTERAVRGVLRNLDKYASTDEQKIAVVNNALERGWFTVFPINKDRGGANNGYTDSPVENKYTQLMRERGIYDESDYRY